MSVSTSFEFISSSHSHYFHSWFLHNFLLYKTKTLWFTLQKFSLSIELLSFIQEIIIFQLFLNCILFTLYISIFVYIIVFLTFEIVSINFFLFLLCLEIDFSFMIYLCSHICKTLYKICRV